MFENSVLALLDPELVVPSPTAARTREFWLRMNAWASRSEYRLGPATLKAIYELANKPNPQWPIPPGDLQQILLKLAARGMSPSNNRRVICAEHLENDYKPEFGEEENPRRLVTDLSVVDSSLRVALATVRGCWDNDSRVCKACEESRITKIFELDAAESLASAWRQSFLEKYPGEFRQIQYFTDRMFPKLRFSSVAWDHLQTLKGDPRDITVSLITHLGALNDLVSDIWSRETTTHGRQRILKVHGVESSPENANTHKDKKATKARRFLFGKHEISCEWHTKLHRHTDRIYFHVGQDEVYIGSIIDHL